MPAFNITTDPFTCGIVFKEVEETDVISIL